ncbi:lipopolysaccharide biosynthesis protein [Polymorphobacter sp.]|uniref:lipopolysaccharide biosynthesis protein n=1 Tax=Polymorphobacter sp. TaxID=1909290 RepID=UPI003F70E11E
MAGTDASMSAAESPAASGHAPSAQETAELARGGRTSFLGYVLRLAARFPFLFIAGRLYGAESLGRFAYATMVVELVAMLATLGLKRGLAEAMAARQQDQTHALYDALLVSLIAALLGAALLIAVPQIVFPTTEYAALERWFPLIIVAIVASDVSLAGLAFRFDIGATVRARSLVEPWVLSAAALALAFTALKPDGLIIAYLASMVAAAAASLWPAFRRFGAPSGWHPRPGVLWLLARRNVALAGADIAEWGAHRLDVFILGRFAPPEIVGIYYIAQQIASLPQRLKSSFDPILAPVLATNIAEGRTTKAALHIRQIGFWVGAAQLGVVLALGITGQASMGLFGPVFASGALILALLLLAELFAAQAAVAEAALVYVARGRNLMWSAAGILIQAGLSVLLVPRYGGEGAAAALAAAALILSVGKSRLLARLLAHPVAGWRWSLLLAGAPAFAIGLLFLQTPEWVQLGFGQWLVLAVFCAIIWRFGFKGADRLLFARSLRKEFPEA